MQKYFLSLINTISIMYITFTKHINPLLHVHLHVDVDVIVDAVTKCRPSFRKFVEGGGGGRAGNI